jgi:prevent-host-death family protein
MATVKLNEAKTHLSELVQRAEVGEEIEITRHGKVVARLVPASSAPVRIAGQGRGTVEYLEPLEFTDDELDDMLNNDIEP